MDTSCLASIGSQAVFAEEDGFFAGCGAGKSKRRLTKRWRVEGLRPFRKFW
jgi:hypothetical protein